MKQLIVAACLALSCGAAACDSALEPSETRTVIVDLGRTVFQFADSTAVVDWSRSAAVIGDPDVAPHSRVPVTSIAIDATLLPLLHSDSLIYGFEPSGAATRLAAGVHTIDVKADAPIDSFRTDALIPGDARITFPAPGATVSISRGVDVAFDDGGSVADWLHVGVSTGTQPSVTIGGQGRGPIRLAGVPLALMQPGPANIVLMRINRDTERLSDRSFVRTSAHSTVVLPVMLVP